MTRDFWNNAAKYSRNVNLYNMELWYGQPLPTGPVARIKIFVAILRDTPSYDVIKRFKIGAMIKKEVNRCRMTKISRCTSRKWN